MKNYFDAWGEDGFDYAYRYPGMNKVLQAAGRVIRTVDDFGIVVLLDERFLTGAYQRLFPREWRERQPVTLDQIGRKVETPQGARPELINKYYQSVHIWALFML